MKEDSENESKDRRMVVRKGRRKLAKKHNLTRMEGRKCRERKNEGKESRK